MTRPESSPTLAAPRPAELSRRPMRRFPLAPLARIGLILALAISQAGCASFWDAYRERERAFSVQNARTQTGRGQCTAALASLDRAQARLDLGLYSRESVLARMRCYEKLGLTELATAHRRLATDFYTDEPMAEPNADGSSVFRVKTVPSGGFERPPAWLKFPPPRYSPYAQRSKIVGRVVISFEISKSEHPRKIRVLEMPHPLLATWAIEAIAAGQPKKKKGDSSLMPGGRYITTFLFEWRWAKEAQEEEFDS